MRVNVYSEEIGEAVHVVETEAKTGKKYPGVRLVLASSEKLHYKPGDDDRSAVTFWFHDLVQAEVCFAGVVHQIRATRIEGYKEKESHDSASTE